MASGAASRAFSSVDVSRAERISTLQFHFQVGPAACRRPPRLNTSCSLPRSNGGCAASRRTDRFSPRSITRRKNEVKNGVARAASREHEDKLIRWTTMSTPGRSKLPTESLCLCACQPGFAPISFRQIDSPVFPTAAYIPCFSLLFSAPVPEILRILKISRSR